MGNDQDRILHNGTLRLKYALRGCVMVAEHEDTKEKKVLKSTDDETREGVGRSARLGLMPPMSVDQWTQLIEHLDKSRTIDIFGRKTFVCVHVFCWWGLPGKRVHVSQTSRVAPFQNGRRGTLHFLSLSCSLSILSGLLHVVVQSISRARPRFNIERILITSRWVH